MPELVLPVSVRGRTIGEIEVHKDQGAGVWTAAEVALMETLTEQLGAALESARLYEDTQDRAARDRLLSDSSARMRESLDVETVLQVAVREISQSLGLAALDVRLGVNAESVQAGQLWTQAK